MQYSGAGGQRNCCNFWYETIQLSLVTSSCPVMLWYQTRNSERFFSETAKGTYRRWRCFSTCLPILVSSCKFPWVPHSAELWFRWIDLYYYFYYHHLNPVPEGWSWQLCVFRILAIQYLESWLFSDEYWVSCNETVSLSVGFSSTFYFYRNL